MNLTIPPKFRAGLYVFTLLGTPVISYLFAKQFIGELEVALWGAEVTAVSAMALFNINRGDK